MYNNTLMHKFILFLVAALCIFAFQNFLMLQPVRAAEMYERKSISFVKMLAPGAAQIPEDKLSKFMTAIEEQIKIPRLDYNALPKSLRAQFQERTSEHCSKTLEKLDSIGASIKQIDDFSLSKILLSNRKSNLLNLKRREEEALVRQISELLTETLTPTLIKILSDHGLQKLRGQKYVSEEERNQVRRERG